MVFLLSVKKYKWSNHERFKLSEHCERLILSGQCEQRTVDFLIGYKQGNRCEHYSVEPGKRYNYNNVQNRMDITVTGKKIFAFQWYSHHYFLICLFVIFVKTLIVYFQFVYSRPWLFISRVTPFCYSVIISEIIILFILILLPNKSSDHHRLYYN